MLRPRCVPHRSSGMTARKFNPGKLDAGLALPVPLGPLNSAVIARPRPGRAMPSPSYTADRCFTYAAICCSTARSDAGSTRSFHVAPA